MDLNARVDINCGRKDRQTENWMPISHLAKAAATKTYLLLSQQKIYLQQKDTFSSEATLPFLFLQAFSIWVNS